VTNSGAASAKVFLYLTFDNSTFTAGTTTSTTNVKYVSTTSVPMGQTVTINSCMHSVLGQNATTAFKGKETCQWVIVCTNTAPLTGGTFTRLTIKQEIDYSTHGQLGWIDNKKLVKYSLIGGKDKPVKVPWTIKISENVSLSTKANVIEFIYMMLYANGGGDNTARYDEFSLGTFTLNDGNNISGSAQSTVYIDINPHSIKKNSANLNKPMYGAWLMVKCGETSGK
jgi:hypothetical protein